jgi:Na+/H+ antiporter NhaD/arsenite permease-like protein
MLAIGIFLLTYALIAGRRLRLLPIGRPAGALLGCVLMVAVGVLSPAQALAAVDLDTIVLLFGMMVVNVYVAEVKPGTPTPTRNNTSANRLVT